MVNKRLNKDIVEYRIQPYIKEASIQLILDILLIGLIVAVSLIAGFSAGICISVIVGYIIMALLLHYRIAIQAIIDIRKGDYVTETVYLKEFDEEYSFIGDRTGHSYIQYFYPKDMHVRKMKIKVIKLDCRIMKIRSVMSFIRVLNFIFVKRASMEYFTITYLKRSKILVGVELYGDIDELLRKERKKSRKWLEKTIKSVTGPTAL